MEIQNCKYYQNILSVQFVICTMIIVINSIAINTESVNINVLELTRRTTGMGLKANSESGSSSFRFTNLETVIFDFTGLSSMRLSEMEIVRNEV